MSTANTETLPVYACVYNGMYNVMHDYSTTQHHKTALHHASISGHRDIVQLLLEKGADPNIRDEVSLLFQICPVPTLIHCICA